MCYGSKLEIQAVPQGRSPVEIGASLCGRLNRAWCEVQKMFKYKVFRIKIPGPFLAPRDFFRILFFDLRLTGLAIWRLSLTGLATCDLRLTGLAIQFL